MRTVVEQLVQDLRYGVRGLRRSRAFLTTTVLTLAVGVGLLAVAFTVVNAYVLRPYAVRDPQQLHQVGWRSRDGGGQSFRWREYEELRDRTDVFESAVAESTRFVSSNGRPLAAALVSDNYFEALGPAVFMGRTWRADERGVEGVVLSHQGWMRLFVSEFWPNEDPIGKTVNVEPAEGRPVDDLPGYSTLTVVGVARDVVSGFIVDGLDRGHIYLPAASDSPRVSSLLVRGRTPGEPSADALDALFRQVAVDPQLFEPLPLDELRTLQIYPLRAASWIGSLLAAVALTLSIAGLYGVLSFTIGQRTREIGIRMALGATGTSVVQLVVRYSMRLAGLGAFAGVVAAFAALSLLSTAIRLRQVSLVDGAAFTAAVGVVVLATVLAAYQPARRATRVDPSQALRAEG